jgi:hypothetical protein
MSRGGWGARGVECVEVSGTRDERFGVSGSGFRDRV